MEKVKEFLRDDKKTTILAFSLCIFNSAIVKYIANPITLVWYKIIEIKAPPK